MTTKSFKGQLVDGGIDTINLHTIKGRTGYRITKFQVMGPDGNTNIEHVLKIYKTVQTTATTDIQFTDTSLLAAAVFNDVNDPHYLAGSVVVFDNEVFNQDIYVTSKGHDNTGLMNYYIELETIEMSESQTTQVTLKNLRAIASR